MPKIQTNLIKKPIFLDQDGSTDDLVSLMILLTLKKYRLTGTSITNGNCYSKNAVESTLRILNLFSKNDIHVAVSDAKPMNVFPVKWRERGKLVNTSEVLKNTTPDFSLLSKEEAADFTARTILQEKEKTTIIATGPANNLVNTIEKYPEIKDKIDRIIWMAGAFLADGNVISPDHDGSAEWNIFSDPIAAQKLLYSDIKIIMFPLDACYLIPIDDYLMYHLNKNSKKILSRLVHEIFMMSIDGHRNYYMWDVLPAMYLDRPEIAHLVDTSADIEIRGTSLGNIFKTSKGKPVRYANLIDEELFYKRFIKRLKKF